MTTPRHSYRPLREYTGQNKTAREIQADLDLIRAMRVHRFCEEQRGARFVGKCFLTAAIGGPAIAAIVAHLIR